MSSDNVPPTGLGETRQNKERDVQVVDNHDDGNDSVSIVERERTLRKDCETYQGCTLLRSLQHFSCANLIQQLMRF